MNAQDGQEPPEKDKDKVKDMLASLAEDSQTLILGAKIGSPRAHFFRRGQLVRLGILLIIVALVAGIIYFTRHIDTRAILSKYGYFAVFALSVLSSATVLFPVPGPIATFFGGTLLTPWAVALVAGLGEPLGELTGYGAGFLGRGVVANRKTYIRIENWMKRYGVVSVFLFSAVPNPAFDLVGIAAGALRVPVWRFLIACWAGKTIKALVIAYLGAGIIRLFS